MLFYILYYMGPEQEYNIYYACLTCGRPEYNFMQAIWNLEFPR